MKITTETTTLLRREIPHIGLALIKPYRNAPADNVRVFKIVVSIKTGINTIHLEEIEIGVLDWRQPVAAFAPADRPDVSIPQAGLDILKEAQCQSTEKEETMMVSIPQAGLDILKGGRGD